MATSEFPGRFQHHDMAPDPDDPAFLEFASLVEKDPGAFEGWDGLEDWAADGNQPDPVARVYWRALESGLDESLASELAQRAVGFHEEWYGEDAPALIALLRKVLAIDPSSFDWVFPRLTVAYTSAEDWEGLLSLYDEQIAKARDPERACSLLEEAIQAAKDFADAPDRAIDYLKALLVHRPGDASLEEQIRRLLERQERWAELIAVLRDRARHEAKDVAARTRLEIATLYVDKAQSPADALAEVKGLLADGHGSAEITSLLERIAELELSADLRRDALDLLRARYAEEGRDDDVVRVLSASLEIADEGEKRTLHRDAATRLAQAGDVEGAFVHVTEALRLDPRDAGNRQLAREVAEVTGDHARYVETLAAVAEGIPDSDLRAEYHLEVGRAAEERLADSERAVAHYDRVVAEPEATKDAARRALSRLVALHGAAGRAEAQLAAVERASELEDDAAARRKLLFEAARLAQALGDSERALVSLRTRLEEDSRDDEALDALIETLRVAERWDEYVDALSQRVSRNADRPFQARADLVERARVQETKLERLDAAIETWGLIAERFGEDGEAVDALDRLFESTARYADLAALLDRAASREGHHLAQVRCRIGEVFERHLGRPADAARAFAGALEGDPRNETARAGLARLADVEEVAFTAVEGLAKAYLAADEWEPVLALLEQRLALAADDAARLVLLKEAAQIQEHRAGAPAAALGTLGRAFAMAPMDERLELDVLRLGALAGDAALLADVLAAAAAAVSDPLRKSHLRAIEAKTREESLGDAAGAFAAYVEAFELNPTNLELARAVRRLGVDERLERAEAALAQASARESVSDEILGLYADVLRETQKPALFAVLNRLAARFPTHLDLLVEALAIAPEAERRAALVTLYERAAGLFARGARASGTRTPEEVALDALDKLVAELEASGEAREAAGRLVEGARLPVSRELALSFRRRAAALYAGPLEDPITAVDIYRDVLRDAPDDVEAFDALGKLLERQGRLPELLELRQREIETCADRERRIELRLDLARLVDRIEREGGRIEALRANLAEAPGHVPSIEALEAVLCRYGQFDEVVDLLASQAEATSGTTAARLYERLARIAADSLGDAERAIQAYRKVVEIEPRVSALDALAELHVARGEHAAAARWLERRLALTDDAEKTRVSLALARSLALAGREESVPEVLEAARAIDPGHPELRELLAAHYRKVGASAPLAALLADATHYTEGETKLALAREAALLYDETLGQPAEAIPMLRIASELDREDKALRLRLAEALFQTSALDEAKAVLEELAGEFGRRRTPERAQVHFLLGQVARAQGNLQLALDELETATKMAMSNAPMLAMLGRLAREAGDIDRSEKSYRTLLMLVRRRPPEDAVDVGVGEVLFELHDIAKQRGEAEKASELLDSAFETVSQSDEEALRFAEALTERGEPELGLRGLELRLQAELPREAKGRLLHAAARILERLGRDEEALARRLAALEADSRSEEALASTRRLAKAQGRSRELLGLLETIAESLRRSEDVPWVAALRLLQGEIAEEDVQDTALATAALEKALALEGEHQLEARVRLARLARARGDRAEERRLLESLLGAEGVSPRVEVEARYRLAEIVLVEGEGAALAMLRSAYAVDPRASLALPVLKQLAEVEGASEEVFAFYEEVARGSADDAILLDFFVLRSQREGVTFEQLREGAEKAIAVGRFDVARPMLESLAERAELEGARDEARWAYRRLADQRESEGDLVGAIEWLRRALGAAEGDERREMQRDLAEMARRPGGDLQIAAELYRELLADSPADPEIYHPLLEVLAALDDDAAHADLVAQLLEALLDVEARNEIRVIRARYLLGKPDRQYDAVEVLKDALDDQPDHAAAAELLGKIYEESGYDEELVELLRRKLDVAYDAQDREVIVTATLKLGALLEKVDREDALETYRRAVDVVTDDRGLIEALLTLLGEDGDEDERTHLTELLLGVSTGDEASALARKLIAAHEARDDQEAVLRALDLGFRGNPADDELRERLEAHYRESGLREALASFLFVDAGRLAESSPEAALERVVEAATILREEVGKPEEAARKLRDVVAARPNPALVDEMVRCYEAAGQHGEALEQIGHLIEAEAEGSARRIELLRLRARLLRGLGQAGAAAADLEQAYAASPAVIDELAEALAEARDQASVGDDAAFRAHAMRLVDLLEGAGRELEARDALAHYLSIQPSDVEALHRLRVADGKTQNWPGVAWACERLVEISTGEAQIEAVLALCDACDNAGSPGDARSALESVLAAQPSPILRERLKSLYEASGAHRELAEILLAEAAEAEDEAQRFELFRHAGELLVGIGEGEAALPALEAAYAMQPDDHRTVVALVDARTLAGLHAEAGALLEQAIENHPKRRSPELSQLQHRMARLAGAAGDRKLEMDWLNQALLTDKQNVYVAAELAELSMELGEYEIALEALRAITIAKTDGPMSRAMAFLLQAKIAQERGEGRRALLWARKARTEDPDLQEAADFLKELGEP